MAILELTAMLLELKGISWLSSCFCMMMQWCWFFGCWLVSECTIVSSKLHVAVLLLLWGVAMLLPWLFIFFFFFDDFLVMVVLSGGFLLFVLDVCFLSTRCVAVALHPLQLLLLGWAPRSGRNIAIKWEFASMACQKKKMQWANCGMSITKLLLFLSCIWHWPAFAAQRLTCFGVGNYVVVVVDFTCSQNCCCLYHAQEFRSTSPFLCVVMSLQVAPPHQEEKGGLACVCCCCWLAEQQGCVCVAQKKHLACGGYY